MKRILLAGATGYLGNYILSELLERGFDTTIVVRNKNKVANSIEKNGQLEIIEAEVTSLKSIEGCCENIDVVISTVGITNQKDGLTYMDVDYRANLNLLEEAKKQGVKKFIYISVLNGEKLQHLAICKAKELFVGALKNSGFDYCVIRPNGFFSDMSEIYQMARKGRVYLFGDGKLKTNPIHGADLAKAVVDQIHGTETEIKVGGPEVLTQNAIAETACEAAHVKTKITHIPDWVRVAVLKIVKLFLSKPKFGPIEFFMNVMAMEMVAPVYGNHTLKEYFNELSNAQ